MVVGADAVIQQLGNLIGIVKLKSEETMRTGSPALSKLN
jgi:hypothetical protein